MNLAHKKYLVILQKFWELGRPPPLCKEKFPNNPVNFFECVAQLIPVVSNVSNVQVLKVLNSRFYYFTFFCIHLTAMCSASLNPFLYGWLNENISNQVTAKKKRKFQEKEKKTPHTILTFNITSGINMLASQMLTTNQHNIDISKKFRTKPFCHSTLSIR